MKLSLASLLLPSFVAGSLALPRFSNRTRADVVDPAIAQCSDPYLNDMESDPSDRWAAAGGSVAWESITRSWYNRQASDNPSELSFPEYVSSGYNGRDQMICGDTSENSCGTNLLCSQLRQPAGWLILNSFVSLHTSQRNVHSALDSAMILMQSSMSTFSTTFSPAATAEDNSWLTDLLNSFGFVAGIVSAVSWNVVFKATQYAKNNANEFGAFKDSSNSAITFAFNEGKAHIPTATDLQNDLTTVMGTIFNHWKTAQLQILPTLFSGKVENMKMLGGLIDNGLALDIPGDINFAEMITEAQKTLYAQMLPLAWKQSTTKIHDAPRRMYPMILMVPEDCVTSGENLSWMVDSEKSEQMSGCHDGHTFFVGFATWTYRSPPEFNPNRLRLWALPGGEKKELTGDSEKWGGLTLKDMVISVYEGYRKNGYSTGYKMPENSIATAGIGADGQVIAEGGVRTPGFVDMPLCTVGRVFSEARDHHEEYADKFKTYPCGDGALIPEEMTAFGFS